MRCCGGLWLGALLVLGSCTGQERDANSQDEAAIRAEIKVLAEYVKVNDPDDTTAANAVAAFDKALQSLTQRGAVVEPFAIEALNTGENWGTRYGAIDLLAAVGSRSCIEELIAALADENDLVALKAMMTLNAKTQHQEVPDDGVADNGLPAIPSRPAGDVDPDTDLRLWRAWREKNGGKLHDCWKAWWDANAKQVKID